MSVQFKIENLIVSIFQPKTLINNMSDLHRDRLLAVNAKDTQNTERLKDVQRTVNDTLDTAGAIMVELNKQHEQIVMNIDHVDNVHANMYLTRRLIGKMMVRNNRYKIMLSIFILIFLGVIAYLIYYWVHT